MKIKPTPHSFGLRLGENSSLLARQQAPPTSTCIRHRSSRCGSHLNSINRWVVGALYSSWRAVYQYLYTHHRDDQDKWETFFRSWGENEFWIEKTAGRDGGDQFSDAYRQLMNRNIDIALQEDGLEFQPKSDAPLESLDPKAEI